MNETNNLKSEAMAKKIEDIIYHTTRGIYSIEDKLSIAVVFLFCYKLESKIFAELLYTEKYNAFIEHLADTYDCYNVDFSIKFEDKLINECFLKTRVKVREVFDKEEFYKALHGGDAYALSIIDIVNNCHFNKVDFITGISELKNKLH